MTPFCQVVKLLLGLNRARKRFAGDLLGGFMFAMGLRIQSRANRIRLLRDADGDGKPEVNEIFANGLNQPFGIAFYPVGPDPKFIYVGNTDSVVRFPYKNGDLKATAAAAIVVPKLPANQGHWTRDVVFSKDGQKMFVAVGSGSNVDDPVVRISREANAHALRTDRHRIQGRIHRQHPRGPRTR